MSSPAPEPDHRQPAGRWLWLPVLILLVLIGGVVVSALNSLRTKPNDKKPEPDMVAAMAANTRGVGLMEQYEYPKAAKEFEEATKLAPDWLPARVNLGIALLNENTAESKGRATDLFREVLKTDPDNKHAHYCLGILDQDASRLPEAHAEFAAVHKLDPNDPHTLFRLASTDPAGTRSPEARKYFEEALKLDPYLNAARYNLGLILVAEDPERGKKLLDEFEALKAAEWSTLSGTKYGEMGKYADVIGRYPATAAPVIGPVPVFDSPADFKVTLAPGAKWATAADLGPAGAAQRERFGGSIVLFDYNRDGRADVLLLSAVVENGKVRDLLLKNEGNNKFTDVTAAAGLSTSRESRGAAAGDYDNDGHPDLVITTAAGARLFRNKGDGTFADVSTAAGLDKLTAACLGCAWADLDQDGDLDLLLASTGGAVLFENVGVAPPAKRDEPQPALTTAFRRDDRFAKAVPAGETVGFLVSDLDADRDLDVMVFPAKGDPVVVANDRLMRFHRAEVPWLAGKGGAWNGGLALDANHDERSDLFLVPADGPPVFLLSKGARDFAPGHTNSPRLKQAVAVDLDMDGWPDVVGLSADGKPVLLQNQGDGRLEHRPDAFGVAEQIPAGVYGVACASLGDRCPPDLLLWSDAGLHLRQNKGNGNNAVLIDPTGRRDKGKDERTNADGIGSWVIAQIGNHWTGAERTTISAGLGQSLLPAALGLGKAGRADAVRLRWPDGTLQAQLGVNTCTVARIVEDNRKGSSCPVLMTWDGERFAFVTDFLGAGSMGESNPDGSTRPPRGEEAVKIEPGQLRPKDGRFLLKIAEPMDEVLYLDHLRLDAIDHPADVAVFPDERFATAGPPPSQELLAFRTRHFPKRATDHRGRDVTKLTLDRDRRAVDGFAVRSWLGYAEDHSLTLDFGELPAGNTGRWFLVLAGWTEYPYPESIYAATRAGVPLNFPVLERIAADGKTWEPLGDLGFPAGLPRVMTRELAGFAPAGKCVLRIRTNMQVFWDQVYLARAEDFGATAKVTPLEVAGADLAHRGFMQEVYPDGRPPAAYDDARTEPVAVTKWKGNLTRLGDVTELLRGADDRFAICGPGDEITVRFDATKLPPLPAGWKRSFVLRSWGYCKDAAPTTVTGGQVGPLPFRGMPNYPDFGSAKPPATDAARWHIRPAGGK